MSRVLSFIKESVASLGFGNGLLVAIARALDQATGGRCRLFKYYFVAQPVPAEPAGKSLRKSSTEIYFASPGMAIVDHFPRPPEVIKKRFADGAVCLVAERSGTLVGFIWIKSIWYCEDEVRCTYVLDPPEKLAWDFDVFVAPEFRFSRAFAQLWAAAHRFLRERGYQWSISRISAFNANSLDSHKRLGIVRLATGVFANIGPVQLAAFSCSPYVHVAISRAIAPRLVFQPPTLRSDR